MDDETRPDPIGVSYDKAAELLQVSRKTIEEMVDRGDLQAFTIGANPRTGKLRISYESLRTLPGVKQIDPADRSPRRFTKG